MEAKVCERMNERKADERLACCMCDRTLKNPSEWIRSRNRVICVVCYESLLNPLEKCSACGSAV
jgi:hypothetical protein